MQKKLIAIFTIIFSFLLIAVPVHAFTMGSVNFTVDGANFDNGGGDSSSANYLVVNSAGENVLAQASSASFTDNSGPVFFNPAPTPTPTSAPTSSSTSTSTTTTTAVSATPTPTTTAIAQAPGTGGTPTTASPEEQTPPLFDIEVGPGSLESKKKEVPILAIITVTIATTTAAVALYIFKRRKKRTDET